MTTTNDYDNNNDTQNATHNKNAIEQLEHTFWQSMLDNQPQVATNMLTEPALMVSSHGINQFDHATYTQMAQDTRYNIVDYKLSSFKVLFPTDAVGIATYQVDLQMQVDGKPITMKTNNSTTWVKIGSEWKCAAHTENEQTATQQ